LVCSITWGMIAMVVSIGSLISILRSNLREAEALGIIGTSLPLHRVSAPLTSSHAGTLPSRPFRFDMNGQQGGRGIPLDIGLEGEERVKAAAVRNVMGPLSARAAPR
jgi:hypothetical protein